MSTTIDERYAYRPGLIFLSKHAGLMLSLWEPKYHTYSDGSREMTEPAGFAEFDLGLQTNTEFVPEDEDGNPVTTAPVMGMENYHSMPNVWADIRGGAFDLDAVADHYGWDDEQKSIAARKMLRLALDPKIAYLTLYEPKPPTPPWPTYDSLQNYLEIAKLADDLGLLDEALFYEMYTKKRKGVLEALHARKADHEAEEALTAE